MGTLINDKDLCLFHSVAKEVIKLAGTTAIIYQFDEDKSVRDPLWDEELDTEYKKNSRGVEGIECPVFFQDPSRTGMSGEEGYRLDRISELHIAAKDLQDRGLRRLRPGDIIKVWDMYFDVTESHAESGIVNDSPQGVATYVFDVARRTKDVPESVWIDG